MVVPKRFHYDDGTKKIPWWWHQKASLMVVLKMFLDGGTKKVPLCCYQKDPIMVVLKSTKSFLKKKLLHTYKPFLINVITKSFLRIRTLNKSSKKKTFYAKIHIYLPDNT